MEKWLIIEYLTLHFNILGHKIDVLVYLAVKFAVIRLFSTPLQAVKCCYYSNNSTYFLFRVDYCRFGIWLLFFYLNRDIFPISIQGAFSSALSHDTVYIPTLTNQRNRSPATAHDIHSHSLYHITLLPITWLPQHMTR